MSTLDPYDPEDDQSIEYLSLERAKLLDAIRRMDLNLFLSVCAFLFALAIDTSLLFAWVFIAGKNDYSWGIVILLATVIAIPINIVIYKWIGRLLKL